MVLKIYLLGQFKVSVNDLLIELSSRPAQSLLAYLVLNAGVAHRREKLAGLMWPDAVETNARSYLRQALWRIRKSLDSVSLKLDSYLNISDISVTFNNHSDYWLDAGMLQENVEGRPIEEVIRIVSLYQGELLPGFYDNWIILERDRLQSVYHQKMNHLLESLIQGGQWDQVIKWCERWIQLGYAPEPAFRALMKAHSGIGDQSMVSATYQRCFDSINRELGLEPASETKLLYEQILRGDLDLSSPTPVSLNEIKIRPPAFLEGESPQIEIPIFVAREDELTQLKAFLDLAISGQGGVAFITGEAGSGKTALINEFSHHAQETHLDLVVAWGNCNAHTGIGDPYLPFREVLELLTGDVEAHWTAGTMTRDHSRCLWETLPITVEAIVENGPDLINTFVQGPALVQRLRASFSDTKEWKFRVQELAKRQVTNVSPAISMQFDLLDQYYRVLSVVAHKKPLLIILDDLQWADAGSINLLFHIGRQLAGDRILIIGAYRPEEVALGRDFPSVNSGKHERHPLEPVINEFQRDFGEIIVDLSKAERREFVNAILDSEPNQLGIPFREMLLRQTRGHPLFTTELLRGLQERGDLIKDPDSNWIVGPALDWETLPARVEAVIAERIGRLPQKLRNTLEVACVEGEDFTAEVVAHVLETDKRAMVKRLSNELSRKHRLVRVQAVKRIGSNRISQYRFRNFLFQKYLYDHLDEVEQAYLHEDVGIKLEHLYGNQTSDIDVQLAWHFQEAGIAEKAIPYLQQAGEKALQLSAYEEGITHLTRGLALLIDLPDSAGRAEQELALQFALGIAWAGSKGFGPEVKQVNTRASELCQQLGDTYQLCRVVGEQSIYHYVRAELDMAREYAEEGLDLAQQTKDSLLVALGNWHLGFILFCLGDFQTALGHLERVITFYNPKQHHHSFVVLRGSDAGPSALAYAACCLWCLGYPDQAQKRSKEALTLAHELGHPFTLADVLCFAGCLLNEMRRDAHAFIDYSEKFYRLASEAKLHGWLGQATWYRGEALVLQGNLDEGITQIQDGLSIKTTSERCYQSGGFCAMAESYTKNDKPEVGLTILEEAFALIEETNERYGESELHRVRAEMRLKLGDIQGAEKSLLKAIDVANQQSAKSWELRATTDLARLWSNQGKPDEARLILEEIYGWFTEGFDTPDLIKAHDLLEKLS